MKPAQGLPQLDDLQFELIAAFLALAFICLLVMLLEHIQRRRRERILESPHPTATRSRTVGHE